LRDRNRLYFHSGYLDYRGAFNLVLDSYYNVCKGLNKAV